MVIAIPTIMTSPASRRRRSAFPLLHERPDRRGPAQKKKKNKKKDTAKEKPKKSADRPRAEETRSSSPAARGGRA